MTCIEYQWSDNGTGYKRIRFRGRSYYAHRLVWELVHGPIPAGMVVCHRCDNRGCINISHLFLGTQADNVHDAIRKGRASPPPRTTGENHHKTKLSDANVRTVRQLAARGHSCAEIGRRFGVTRQSVSQMVRGVYRASAGAL